MGLLHVYTGNGKGKSSMALGMTMRMLGAGGKVLHVQFFKFENSDKRILEQMRGVRFLQFSVPGDYFKTYTEDEKREVRERLKHFLLDLERVWEEGFDLVVLDEFVYTISMGLLSVEEALGFVSRLEERSEVIITGRNAPEVFIQRAAYVTECGLVKHPYYEGVQARRGIDY